MIIIYLASYDPSARANHKELVDQRKWTLGEENVKLQIIEIKDHKINISNPAVSNVFESLSLNQDLHVELVAHGDGSSWIKCMPFGKWDYTPGASNTYKDINATQLKEFFKTHASENGRYKFNELTLFCCNGYQFAKELALLMPEIKITCFKEFIKIRGANGMAYPYTVIKEDNQTYIKPIDKNGELITHADQHHYCAAQWVLEGNQEKTIYACADAIPGYVTSQSNINDSRPVVIRSGTTTHTQTELRSSQGQAVPRHSDLSSSSEIDDLNTDAHSDNLRRHR